MDTYHTERPTRTGFSGSRGLAAGIGMPHKECEYQTLRYLAIRLLHTGLLAGGALCCLLVASGCGRHGAAKAEDVSDLWISRYNVNFDDRHDITRILAEISNDGKETVKTAGVTAILRGPTGENRGENRKILRNLQPGKPQVFSISVTSHGEEHSVEFRIDPGEQSEEPRVDEAEKQETGK